MKRFLKKRWHSIPVALLSALLVLALAAGGVFAAYNFLDYTADVTVEEAIGVQFTTNDPDVTWDGNTITIKNLVVGDFKCGYFAFTNVSQYSDLLVTIDVTPDPPGAPGIDMYIQGHDIGYPPDQPNPEYPYYPFLDGFSFVVPAGTTSYTIDGGPHLITCVIVEAGAETPTGTLNFTIEFSRSAAQ